MVRPALLLAAFVVALVAGCNSSSDKPFTTSSASPPIDNLPPGVKLRDQKGTPKGSQKVDKTAPN